MGETQKQKRVRSLKKMENQLKSNFLIQYIASIIFFISTLVAFYIVTKLPLFTTGFYFDIFISISCINLVYLFTRRDLSRVISLTILSTLFIMDYISDSMYYRSFKSYGSIADIANLRWLDFKGYGVGVNLVIVFFICSYIAYLIIIWICRNKNYLYQRKKIFALGLLIFMPYFYCFLIGIQEYSNVADYYHSKTYIFLEGLGKLLNQKLFLKEFGYSIFRYEDVNSVIVDIIKSIMRWFK